MPLRSLIVYAHPEPSSFSGALLQVGRAALERAGCEVVVSDLYGCGFQPVSDRRNFRTIADPARFHQHTEEAYASAHDGYADDVQREMDRVAACDLLVFQFPLWWLGPPAILKGWIDRVFSVGRAYGGGRHFETGMYAGKRALCSITVGGPPTAYADGGMYASMDDVLYPIHHGVLAFTGFEVLPPYVVHGPARMDPAVRERILAGYGAYLAEVTTTSRVA